MDQTQQLLRRLQTPPTDPDATRHLVLDTLLALVDAERAVYCSVDDDGICLRVRDWFQRGPSMPTCQRFVDDLQSTVAAIEPTETRGFHPVTTPRPPFLGCEQGAQMRFVIVHRHILYGWIGLLRSTSAPPFTRHARRRLAPVADAVRAAIVGTGRYEAWRPSADFVCDVEGRILYSSNEAKAWLDVDGLGGDLSARVRAVEAGHAPTPLAAGRATLVHIDGPPARVLVRIEERHRPRLAPDHILSPAQRLVARHLADGWALQEVATTLGRTKETIRSHAKEIYRRLDVRSRPALKAALGPSPVTPAKP